VDREFADGEQPDVIGLLGASEDGEVVYFAARGQIVPGAPLLPGQRKIYRWHWGGGSPGVDYLGALSSSTFGGDREARNWDQVNQQVTPDGRYLVVDTRAALDPAGDRDGDIDVYRWDAQDGWRCVSCQAPGAPSAGNSFLGYVGLRGDFVPGELQGGALKLVISDDGRVFFATPEALVAQDANGEAGCPDLGGSSGNNYTCQDIYEWNDGTVSLISDAAGEQGAHLIGVTPSGESVAFYTTSRLVGWDTDGEYDIYVARTGGGFSEPPAVPPGCEGDACRAATNAAPNTPGAGSAAFQGPPDPRPTFEVCGSYSKKAQRKLAAAKRADGERARKLRKQADTLKRRAKRCNRRQAR
jgi:hypothetical protein